MAFTWIPDELADSVSMDDGASFDALPFDSESTSIENDSSK